MNKLLLIFSFFFVTNFTENTSCSNKQESSGKKSIADSISTKKRIIIGAERFDIYLPLLKNKNIALVVNHTSVVGKTHLVDTLLSLKVNIKKIFAPEHGFRGKADAGETVGNETDKKTGLPIISLYGNNKKPSKENLVGIDIVIFDIQDVGVRFYTYISTMHYIMEACAENNKELIVLDRPNPNGFYISGPVLDMKYKSFVGMHPIPIVHGLTICELAKMINGEKWLDSGKVCKLKIVTNLNYTHKDNYSLPVKPSPNLPNDFTIQVYPSIGLFEGTNMSIGKSTELPFQVIGSPDKNNGKFYFIPKRIPGMAKPLFENDTCYGIDLRIEKPLQGLSLKYLIYFYEKATDKEKYFNNFFNKLAGNNLLKEQIKSGLSETEIRESWEAELNIYKAKRKKYLLYQDF